MIIMNGEQRSKIMYNNTAMGNIQDIYHDYMVEENGTIWLHFFHQNNKAGTNLFSSSNHNPANYIFVNYDCWSAGPLLLDCNHGTNYELLAIQDGTRHRWIQTKNPLGATHSDVAREKITILEGLSYPIYGGLYAIANGTGMRNMWINGNTIANNWWGTGNFGGWSGGVPGFNGIVTTGNQDIYIRVYSIPNTGGDKMLKDLDGTTWLQLSHQTSAANNRFTSVASVLNGNVWLNENCWSRFPLLKSTIYNFGTDFEMLVIQNEDGKAVRHRWKQTYNPYYSNFATTAATAITAIENTAKIDGTGYMGGMYPSTVTGTFNVAWIFNDGTNGNWYGCGALNTGWEVDKNSIPGYSRVPLRPTVLSSQDVYVRIYN